MIPNLMKRLARNAALIVAVAISATVAHAADPMPTPAPAATGTRFVYLIRHGIYDRDDKVDDHVGNGLNALGREQEQLAGARLAALPIKINTLVSSTLLRAMESADVIGATLKMKPERDSLLNECTPQSDNPAMNRNHSVVEITQCEAQLQAAWSKYMKPSPEGDRYDVLVFHGNAIRWFTAKALGMDTRQWGNFDIGNGSLTVIAVRPDGSTRLAIFSDVGHLPVEKQTWSGKGGGWGKK